MTGPGAAHAKPLVSPPITVLVVDDHAVFAQSLAAALNSARGIEVLAIANSRDQAIAHTLALLPDVVLLDLQLPDVQGTELIGGVLAAHSAARIVVLTASVDTRTARAAVEAGCLGYVTKDQGLDDVLAAVRAVAAGQSVMPSHVLSQVLPTTNRRQSIKLTPREQEILELLADGSANDDMAARLGVSRNTVRNHVQNLLVKLGAHSRLEAVALGRREGFLPEAAR